MMDTIVILAGVIRYHEEVFFNGVGVFFCAFNTIRGLGCMTINNGNVKRDFSNIKVLILGFILLPARVSLRIIMDTDNMTDGEVF